MTQSPLAVVVIPTLNEAAHIGTVLTGLIRERAGWPIFVIDGGSTDSTRAVVQTIAEETAGVSLLHNPGRTQAHAVNLGAQIAMELGATYMIRVDAHARYPFGFQRRIVQTLEQTRADSVVVPLIAVDGETAWQKAAGQLQRTWLGHGGAAHRRMRVSGPVRHGHHAGFRLAAFRALGGYDTAFHANEDAEYDARLVEKGGRIYLQSRCAVGYVPRGTVRETWAQYRRNGYWRAKTILTHRQMSFRQMLPPMLVAGLFSALPLATVWPPALTLWGGALLGLVLGSIIAAAGRPAMAVRIALLAAAMHGGFGVGFLTSLGERLGTRPRRTQQRALP